jgi:hypothetical protein
MMFRRTALVAALVFLAFPAPGKPEPGAVQGSSSIVALQPAQHEDSGNGKLAGYLLGGWSKGGWLEDKVVASLLRGGEKYRFYSLNGEVGVGTGGLPAPLGSEDEPCHDTLAVSFPAAPEGREGLVAVAGSFDALPRVPKLLSTEQQVYKDAAAAILREKGIARPDVRLTQVIRVDLDGDGSEEVLVSATRYARGLSAAAAPGDYSLVFLRRLVKDRVVTNLIEGDFFPKGVQFGAPGEHRLGGVLDLNGDGVMEIVLFGRYYEGDWVAAYRVDGDKIIKILTAGCGV